MSNLGGSHGPATLVPDGDGALRGTGRRGRRRGVDPRGRSVGMQGDSSLSRAKDGSRLLLLMLRDGLLLLEHERLQIGKKPSLLQFLDVVLQC